MAITFPVRWAGNRRAGVLPHDPGQAKSDETCVFQWISWNRTPPWASQVVTKEIPRMRARLGWSSWRPTTTREREP